MTLGAEIHRPDFGVRVIIVWKAIKGGILTLLGVAAILLRHSDLHELATDLVDWLGLDPASPRLASVLDQLTSMTPNRITMVGVGALVVAAVMFIESWGLHRRRTWAEWLTVIMTSVLIPLEIYHLVSHPSLGKVLTLVANVAIVIYLLRHRFLFRR